MLDELTQIEAQLSRLEAEIERNIPPFQNALQAWMSIPGVKQRVAWTLVAEIGPDMQVFPSPAHIASWAGVCPGNNESDGQAEKRKKRAKETAGHGGHSARPLGLQPRPRKHFGPPSHAVRGDVLATDWQLEMPFMRREVGRDVAMGQLLPDNGCD